MVKRQLVLLVGAVFLLQCASPDGEAQKCSTAKIRSVNLNLAVGFSLTQLFFSSLMGYDSVYSSARRLAEEFDSTAAKKRLRIVAKEIQQNAPDIVALQEVLKLQIGNTIKADFLPELLSVLDSLGPVSYSQYHSAFNKIHLPDAAQSGPEILFEEGNSILYRQGLTLVNSETVLFDSMLAVSITGMDSSFQSQRGAAIARLTHENGITFTVASTHLEILPAIRADQSSELLQIINSDSYKSDPAILLGDWNATPSSPEYKELIDNQFKDALQNSQWNNTATCCIDLDDPDDRMDTGGRIDHIFTKGFCPATESAVLLNTPANWQGESIWASDHAMVMAEFPFSAD